MILKRAGALKLALAWILLISFLFMLPGSAFPKSNVFSKIHFDKWVHFGFFFILTWLWSKGLNLFYKKELLLLFLASTIYGIIVELVQDQFIKYRAFDIGDVLADMAGALAGIFYWKERSYTKKKPL